MADETPLSASGVTPASELGVLAGRYRLVRLLGEGAMGAVYLGEHLKMGRLDAIKVLRGPLAADQEAIARFTRGARNVSTIRHPNVCTIYDYSDTAEGIPFLAMEYIDGETLKDILDRERVLPLERAVRIAAQIADALDAAHDAGIVHRDLKPGNVMIARRRDGSEQVKVVDFDIAKGTQTPEGPEVTRFGFVVGTPEYMSPEQLTGDPLDGRSDLYSLGVVCFRMVTGGLPFRATAPQDLMIERLTQAPLRLSEVCPGTIFPPALQQTLDRALARNVSDRYTSAGAFGRELMQMVRGHSTELAGAVPSSTNETRVKPLELPPTKIVETTSRSDPQESRGTRDSGSIWRGRRLTLAGVATVVIGATIAVLLWPRDVAVPPTQPAVGDPTKVAGLQSKANEGPAGARVTDSLVQPTQAEQRSAQTPPPSATGSAGRTQPENSLAQAANAVLTRQFNSLELSAVPYAAIRDTARSIWLLAGAAPADRAFAAYLLGYVAESEGQPAECVLWLDRAIQLNPTRAYSVLLDDCRKQIR